MAEMWGGGGLEKGCKGVGVTAIKGVAYTEVATFETKLHEKLS